MAAVATRREQWRARLWPASVLSAAGQRAADLLDLLDVAGARLRHMLVRLVPRRGGEAAG
jgi:hypothetical protein